ETKVPQPSSPTQTYVADEAATIGGDDKHRGAAITVSGLEAGQVTTLSDRIGVLEVDLLKTKKTYSSAYTKLILRVKKLESWIKIGKARKQTRVVISDDEAFEDDSSKQGRNGKASDEISIAGLKKGTASEEVPIVSTVEVNLSTARGTVTYSRRSAEKRSRKDKGKAIMIEEEPKKKSKKDLEQERLSYAEAIRLEEQMNEEQKAQIARDAEIARQWDEEERKRAMDEAKSTKKIDWNDPSGNYKISDFKGMSYNDIRPIFEKIWDFNQKFEPMEHETETMKSPEKSPEKMKSGEKMEEDDVVKEPGAKRKKSIPRKSTRKRQKLEEDAEKEELKDFLDIVPREEVPIEVESISTKFLIVDWKTYILTETFMYYQVFRGDGSSKNYKILSEMLEDFDRLDVEELFRLVKERYSTSRPEGFDLMLWGDLHTLFEPDEDDEIWRDQHEYNLLSWRLCDFCGIHILLMENGLAIHMLTEKKYPLSQEMLTKMLSKKLEVDHESSQAFELLRIMDITKAEQIALDDALVAPANRLKIGKCNLRLSSDLKSKEATLQVVYDVLKLTPFYKAFQASADVPEIYMQEFWATASVHNRSIRFKMNNKKHIVNLEYFREMLQICPKIRNQKFDEPPFEQEILTFLVSLGHSGEIRKITDVNVNKLHQPWRSFADDKCH
ncbi:hypothetical protein Tco_0414694, partial [Tanacetum coccineum]